MKFYTLSCNGNYFYFLNRSIYLEATRRIYESERVIREEGEGYDINIMGMADFAICCSPNSSSYVIKKNRADGTNFEGKLTHCMALVEEHIHDLTNRY